MKLEVLADAGAVSLRAADILCGVVRDKPDAVLGLPTGETPVATYAEIERRVSRGDIDFSRASAFAIDEFAGVPWQTPGTNSVFFRERLRVPLPLHLPDPMAPDLDEEIGRLADRARDGGGFDVCVLGVGTNGHIAFNEPPAARGSRARVVPLTPESRSAHAAAFGGMERVPERGMTLGVADLLEARAIVVLATGARKAAIVGRAIEGPQTADVPASWLQSHDYVLWLLDDAAACELRARDRS
jgi:glucosamine-6-phosphate deaminase